MRWFDGAGLCLLPRLRPPPLRLPLDLPLLLLVGRGLHGLVVLADAKISLAVAITPATVNG